MQDAGGSHTSQQVGISDQGASGGNIAGQGPHTVTPATSPPAIVEKPTPVVLGAD